MGEEMLDKVIALRHRLHKYPELSGQEAETKRMLMDFLKENTPLTVTDRGKWFYAEYHPAESREVSPSARISMR